MTSHYKLDINHQAWNEGTARDQIDGIQYPNIRTCHQTGNYFTENLPFLQCYSKTNLQITRFLAASNNSYSIHQQQEVA
jgi:type IV secretory pathway TrbF-like protein